MALKPRPMTECLVGVILGSSCIPKVRTDQQVDQVVERFSRLCEQTRRMLVEAAHDGRGHMEWFWSARVLSKEEKVFGADFRGDLCSMNVVIVNL